MTAKTSPMGSTAFALPYARGRVLEFLFSSGDGSMWAIVDKEEMIQRRMGRQLKMVARKSSLFPLPHPMCVCVGGGGNEYVLHLCTYTLVVMRTCMSKDCCP